MKNKFKNEYILGKGFPWMYGLDENLMVGLNKNSVGVTPLKLKWDNELWSQNVPEYELVLRKVKK